MIRSTLKSFWILATALTFSPLALAESNPAQTLSWSDCVQLALRNEPDLLSAMRSAEASRANYKGSFNGVLPHVSFSNSYTDSTSEITGVGTSEATSWELQGTASLDLFDLSQWATIESAYASLQQSEASVAVTSATTLLSLYKAFAQLLFAQQEVLVNTQIRDTRKTDADMVGLRYNSGSESKGNNMNTQAQLQQSEAALVQAGRDVLTAQAGLSQAVGFDHLLPLVATGTWTAPPAPNPAPNFESLLETEPQVRLQNAVIAQARAAIKTAHSSLWPTVSLNYSRGTFGASEFPTHNPFWTFSGTANYPLFGNGLTATYYASQSAQRAYEKALQDMRSIRNQLLTSMANAWSNYSSAEDQVRVQKAFLEAADQRQHEYDVLYRSGLVTFEDWILVVNDFVSARTSYLQAEQTLIVAEAQWRNSIGEPLGD